MKKVSFHTKTEAELKEALSKEGAIVRSYKNTATKKGSLKEYRASRKNIARIQTALNAVDKKEVSA